MRKVFLIGSDGMLGGELKTRLSDKYDLISTSVQELDITNRESVLSQIRTAKPDVIINCAAYTNVDGCEVNVQLATNVNGYALENIVDAARENNSILIHISTDYVFDGKLDINNIYTEDMQTNPISAYGRSKLIGENYVQKLDKYYILRTAWLYGLGGKNFVKTMLKLSETHDKLSVVCDQHGSPTSTTTLCEIIEQIIEKNPEYGIYHSTNEGFTTWYDFTKEIMKLANKNVIVNPVTSEEYKEMNPKSSDRPKNSMLSKDKLKKVGIIPKKWEEALKDYIKEELK